MCLRYMLHQSIVQPWVEDVLVKGHEKRLFVGKEQVMQIGLKVQWLWYIYIVDFSDLTPQN